MKALIAQRDAGGEQPGDFYWCEDGELLWPNGLNPREPALTGVDSDRSATYGTVKHLSEDEIGERIRQGNGVQRVEAELAELTGMPEGAYAEDVRETVVALAAVLEDMGVSEGDIVWLDGRVQGKASGLS